MSKRLAAIMPILATAMMGDNLPFDRETPKLSKEELEEIREQKEIQVKLNKGLKPYEYDGVIVWALNEKNAIRKLKL